MIRRWPILGEGTLSHCQVLLINCRGISQYAMWHTPIPLCLAGTSHSGTPVEALAGKCWPFNRAQVCLSLRNHPGILARSDFCLESVGDLHIWAASSQYYYTEVLGLSTNLRDCHCMRAVPHCLRLRMCKMAAGCRPSLNRHKHALVEYC